MKVTGWVAHTNMLNLAKPQTNSKPELGTKSSVRAFLIKFVEVKAWCQNQNMLIETQIRLVPGASFCHLHITSTCTKGFVQLHVILQQKNGKALRVGSAYLSRQRWIRGLPAHPSSGNSWDGSSAHKQVGKSLGFQPRNSGLAWGLQGVNHLKWATESWRLLFFDNARCTWCERSQWSLGRGRGVWPAVLVLPANRSESSPTQTYSSRNSRDEVQLSTL